MDTPFNVRRLGGGDVAALRAINALFLEAFGDEASFAGAPPDDAYVERLLANPQFVALAAYDGTAMIGALTGYELPKAEQARSEFYIYDLAVDEAHRRRGVATALIDGMRRVAREAGGWIVFVQADYGDEPAVALYTKLGRREDVMHFDIAIEAGRGDI